MLLYQWIFLAWSVSSKMYVHPGCTSSNLWHGIIDKTVEKCREKRDGRRWKNIHTRTHRFSRSIVVAKTFLLFLPWTTCLRTKLFCILIVIRLLRTNLNWVFTVDSDDRERWTMITVAVGGRDTWHETVENVRKTFT